MGSRPPGLLLLLVLSSLLLIWKSVRGESSYIIDTVGLSILPEDNVQSGTKVTIRCEVSVSSSNVSHFEYLFKFMRDDVLIHTANTTKDFVDYEINPAREADSGNYKCQVLAKIKHKASNVEKLKVTGLQTPILHLNNSTPYESEEFKVTCSATEEKGGLTFNFYKKFRDGQVQQIKRQQSTNNFLETTLTLNHIGDCFLSCDYEITLITGIRRSNISNEIQVQVKELNIIPVMNILPNDIYEPDIVEVTCKVHISLPNIEIFLIKNRAVLMIATGTPLIYRYTPKATDSGELVCKAEWRNVQKENYIFLRVKEVFSKPQLTLEPMDLFEGDTFRFNCSVKVFYPEKIDPKTFKYRLYKDGIELTSAALTDTVAHSKHNGNYSCKVEGIRNSSRLSKNSQTIIVKAKVPVSDPVLSVVGGKIILGKSFQVLCHSHMGTFPIKYTLKYNGLTMNREVRRSGEPAIFDIPPVYSTSDLNTFFCHARNHPRSLHKIAFGQQLLQSTNIIEPVSKPQLIVLPSIDITEGHDIKLVCSIQTGSRPINFTWYHQGSPGALASLSTSNLTGSHSIPNANRKHVGKYYCVSSNPANEFRRSEFVTIGVKIAGWKKALIIVFCILLLLTFCIVIALKTRLLQFKRKSTVSLPVKSVSTKAERLSLTQAEVIEANATPSMMGKSVWSDHVSGSAPVKQGMDTIDREVRNSKQGVPEVPDGKPVEYAQLNLDSDHQPDNSETVDQNSNSENITKTENNIDVHTDDPEDGTCDPAPDC
ncbi:platelet endothelial cell adhesion molecule isoform 2-T2 [Anableps anableps]